MSEDTFSIVVDGYDDEEDVPCDAGPYQPAYDVAFICGLLDRAIQNDEPAWCLDVALGCIAAHGRKDEDALDLRCRDELLRVLTFCGQFIPRRFPDYSEEQIKIALDAAITLTILWGETPEQRATRHPDVAKDANTYLRMMRNDLHNWSLRDELRLRAHQRRAATVSGLLSGSLERKAG